MKDKTDSQLIAIAKDRAFYSPDKRIEAIMELETRGPLDESISEIKKTLNFDKKEEIKHNRYYSSKNNPDLTDDKDAPLLYSRRAIYTFSVIFSVFSGSFLLASNLREKDKPGIGIAVIAISLGLLILVGEGIL